MGTQEEIKAFLDELHGKMKLGGLDGNVVFRRRDKNLNALGILDITPLDRIDYIKKLTVRDCMKGPFDNDDPNGTSCFEFGINIDGTDVYIKLALGKIGKQIDCISFHHSEKPNEYPLK